MDYKYIEQLLERYWECQTTPEEESILKAFFSQKEMPAELARYRSLFEYERRQADLCPGSDFDARVLAAAGLADETDQQPARKVAAQRVTLVRRLRPLFRAAAAVAIVTLLGTAAQHSFTNDSPENNGSWDYNQSAYKDTYPNDPQQSFEASWKVLQIFKEGAQTAVNDSTYRQDDNPATRDN